MMTPDALTDAEVDGIDAWWRAANYLTVGQIYLQANPLLHEPLSPEHIKPRLLGHWGTSPGLSFLYAHLNRVIRRDDLDMIYVAGPGHGGPALLANVYLEGTYTEVYPEVSRDLVGLQRLFRQFSTPGGIPSHVSVPTPGSIHEGGELGYALVHAFGAGVRQPRPDRGVRRRRRRGRDRSAGGVVEEHPVPRTRAATARCCPILHLNGYKISGPTVLGRAPMDDVRELLEGHGYEVHVVAGDDPAVVHRELAAVLDAASRRSARSRTTPGRPAR